MLSHVYCTYNDKSPHFRHKTWSVIFGNTHSGKVKYCTIKSIRYILKAINILGINIGFGWEHQNERDHQEVLDVVE
jgi:hypothetical protein